MQEIVQYRQADGSFDMAEPMGELSRREVTQVAADLPMANFCLWLAIGAVLLGAAPVLIAAI